MDINVISNQNNKTIHNHTIAIEITGSHRNFLRIEALADRYTPIQVDNFKPWEMMYGINGHLIWLCESN